MAQTKKIVTNKFKVRNAERFIESVNMRDHNYYVFAARHLPYEPDDATILQPNNSVQSTAYDITNNMIFGKRITSQDVSHMVNRYEWTSGIVYDMYEHDVDLSTKVFYVYAPDGADWNVYKCLSNGYGAASTVMPTGRDTKPLESPVDGYLWQYMTTVSGSTYNKFKTPLYAPIQANTAAQSNTIPGTVEFIKVTDPGYGYNNYFVGAFRLEDIRLGGVNTTYGILESASSINDFYQGCLIKMTSGAAAGEYREIVNYTIEDNQKKIFLDTAFTNNPQATDTYEIYPKVYVFADGSQTVNCVARAIVDSTAGNSVSRIEILEPGENIREADAVIIPKGVVGVSANATLVPVISPPGGHNSNVLLELDANKLAVSVSFEETEGGYIPASNDYRTVGIVRDPKFDKLQLTIDNAQTIGAFTVGETVQQYKPLRLAGTANTFSNTTVLGNSTLFEDSLETGDYLLITDNSSQNFLGQIAAIANNTSLTLTANVPFTASNYYVNYVKLGRSGVVEDYTLGQLNLTDVNNANVITSATKIVGKTSSATSVVLSQLLNYFTVSNSIDTFMGASTYVGAVSGTFDEDEVISQPSALVVLDAANTANVYANVLLSYQPTARVHSVVEQVGDDYIYLTNVKRIFNTGSGATGEQSQASISISNKYSSDVVKDTGDVLYIENVDPISRASNKSETIKIILEF